MYIEHQHARCCLGFQLSELEFKLCYLLVTSIWMKLFSYSNVPRPQNVGLTLRVVNIMR